MNNKFMKGFTLIEMMIVVAILGIISAIAIPSYAEYIKKGKRADAKVELLKIAQLQESYFVQNLSYASSLTAAQNAGGLGLTSPVTSEQGEYTIDLAGLPAGCNGIVGPTACDGYSLIAIGNGGQASDRCGNFTLTHTGAKGVVGETSPNTGRTCWR